MRITCTNGMSIVCSALYQTELLPLHKIVRLGANSLYCQKITKLQNYNKFMDTSFPYKSIIEMLTSQYKIPFSRQVTTKTLVQLSTSGHKVVTPPQSYLDPSTKIVPTLWHAQPTLSRFLPFKVVHSRQYLTIPDCISPSWRLGHSHYLLVSWTIRLNKQKM